MQTDPIEIALKNLIETRNLLQLLITSSESFDYPMAKEALKHLERKIRELAQLEAKFRQLRSCNQPNIHPVDFTRPV